MNFVNRPKTKPVSQVISALAKHLPPQDPVPPLAVHVCRSLDGLTDGATVDWLTVCHNRVPGFIWVGRNNCRLRRYSVHSVGRAGHYHELGKFEFVSKAISCANFYAQKLANAKALPVQSRAPDLWLDNPRTKDLIEAMKIAYGYFRGEADGAEGKDLTINADYNKIAKLLAKAGVFGYPLPSDSSDASKAKPREITP